MEETTTQPTDASVRFRNVSMAFGDRRVMESLSCNFPSAKISVILGGSGAGKSTLLRLVGGLIAPQSGSIEVAGTEIVVAPKAALRAVRDQVAMLFQGGALLDSLTVFDNIALPLREHTQMSEDAIARRVEETLQSVDLRDASTLLPGELSGGMLRRAALARAIVHRPRILLCDEPFSGLDPISVRRIERLLVSLNRDYGITTIVVSHHIQSTLRMADRVLLFIEGRAVEGSADDLRASDDPEVAAFFAEASA